MRPLLWKEMRDLRLWVVAGLLFAGALVWMAKSSHFLGSFDGYLQFPMPVLLTLAAVGLGAGQIARERHSRTLDYLLVRPVPPSTIVWAKFLAGTVALAILLAALVGLGFTTPARPAYSTAGFFRADVGFQALAFLLFPRYWCVYALTLLFSAMVDRTAKVAAVMTAAAIGAVMLVFQLWQLAPFSAFSSWLPFEDSTGALVNAAKSPSISWGTGAVFSAMAILITALGAALLKRSPERYLGNIALIALTVGVAGTAVASVHVAANRFPTVPPSATFKLEDDSDLSMVAGGDRVGLLREHEIRFVDFSGPSNPHVIATVPMPLWSIDSASMSNGILFANGRKKALPVDELELAIVNPSAPVQEIPLGPVGRGEIVSRPVPVGALLYVGTARDRHCVLHVFDPVSLKEVLSMPLDELRPAVKGVDEGEPPISLLLRGEYLYVTTAANLTSVDVHDPARPRIVSRLPFRPKADSLYVIPRQLAWQDSRLFEVAFWPLGLVAYDLTDPSHPVRQSEFPWHEGFGVSGSGHALYRPWQQGILEYGMQAGQLGGRRYLTGGDSIGSLAIGSKYVFGLTNVNEYRHPKIEAFPLQPVPQR